MEELAKIDDDPRPLPTPGRVLQRLRLVDLRGLRSFTISGWLKPDSLRTGSGGNRIVFCLKRDTSGIDLVCHADGRLRLAVNQWPDRIQNDSSPGKVVVGKWTRFAVTYDSTKAADNVGWQFSRPQDQPREASLVVDRKTTCNVGPVAGDIGPLAIGNFNKTVHSYGLDGQFRGQIRQLEIYGSRISGRGALMLEEIGTRGGRSLVPRPPPGKITALTGKDDRVFNRSNG